MILLTSRILSTSSSSYSVNTMAQRYNIEPEDDQVIDERDECFCEICHPDLKDADEQRATVGLENLVEA